MNKMIIEMKRWDEMKFIGIYSMLGTTLEMTTLVIEKKISWPTLWNTTEEVFSLVMYNCFPREQLDKREEI